MIKIKLIRLEILLFTAGLLFASSMLSNVAHAQSQFVVVANADVPIDAIDKSTVKRIYNGFTTQWKNSTKVKPCYMQVPNDDFWKYMGTTKTGFQKFWTKRVFSGNGVSPIEHGSSDKLIEYVSEVSGAIGILNTNDKNLVGNKCKILTIK